MIWIISHPDLEVFGSVWVSDTFLVPEHAHVFFVWICSVLSEWQAIQYCTLPYGASLEMEEDHVTKYFTLTYFPC
jgi:hypothetical protein